MAFRLNAIPLNKRTEQIARDNELIVDTVHGNIGISTTNGKNEDKIYNSGTERLKADVDSLKIRNKLMNDNLAKIAFGSENNASDKDFEITNALEKKDILGSLQYVINEYSNFVDGIDKEGNTILNEDAFEYDSKLNKMIKKLYDKDGEYSYSYKFRNILTEIYKELANQDEKTSDKETQNIDTISFSYKKLQSLLKDYIPLLHNLESKIVLMEQMIQTLNEDITFNIPNYIKELNNDFEELKYNTKCAKFRDMDSVIFKEEEKINYYQTENEKGYEMIKEDIRKLEDISKTFNDNFITSILDKNYDGDINNYQIDTIRNKYKLANSYIIESQKYYSFPNITNESEDYYKIKLVFDPIENKPLYKYMSFGNTYDPDNLIYYFNYNNLILQYIFKNREKGLDVVNNIFSMKNIINTAIDNQNNNHNYNFIYLFDRIIENTKDSNINEGLFYLVNIYNLANYKEEIPEISFTTNFNFNYFVGVVLLQNILVYKIEEQPEEDTSEEGTEVTEEKPKSFLSKVYTLLRDSLRQCVGENINSGFVTSIDDSITDVPLNRFGNKNNMKEFLGNVYYSGYNNNRIITYNDVKNNIDKYRNSLINHLNDLAENLSNLNYPKFSDTDFYIDNGNYIESDSMIKPYLLLLTINDNSYEYNLFKNEEKQNNINTGSNTITVSDEVSFKLPNITFNDFSIEDCLKQLINVNTFTIYTNGTIGINNFSGNTSF